MPFISIILPNYNHSKFLIERWRSIVNQSFANFEIILLDDASTDGSHMLLEEFSKHPKVSHYLSNNQNSGSPFKQWRKGIELAKGEWIWIAESDDYCSFSFLERLMPYTKDPSLALIYCASDIIDHKGENKGRHKWADALDRNRWQRSFFNSGKQEIKNYLRFRNTITNASSVVFRKSMVSDIDVKMRFCGDWALWLNLLKRGDIAYHSESLNFFRRHEESTRFVKSKEKEFQRFNEYYQIITKHSSSWARLKFRYKYEWINSEWNRKKESLEMERKSPPFCPIELKLLYTLRS